MNSKKYYITDENGNYVDSMSIYKINEKYYYKCFTIFNSGCRRYVSIKSATRALEILNLHNEFSKFNHVFKIVTS